MNPYCSQLHNFWPFVATLALICLPMSTFFVQFAGSQHSLANCWSNTPWNNHTPGVDFIGNPSSAKWFSLTSTISSLIKADENDDSYAKRYLETCEALGDREQQSMTKPAFTIVGPKMSEVQRRLGFPPRKKLAIVLGPENMIKRDFPAIEAAYAALNFSLRTASELQAMGSWRQLPSNPGFFQRFRWKLLICLSLNTARCLSLKNFVRHEKSRADEVLINRIALMNEVLWSKAELCATVQWSTFWVDSFAFPCFVVPFQNDELLSYLHKCQFQHRWIAKPFREGGGNGIIVVDDESELRTLIADRSRKLVLQPYLEKPFLLNNRKWDIRAYVLVTSVSPVSRVYLYQDGLVRLASENYKHNAPHGGNRTQFLTNVSVNRKKAKIDEIAFSFDRLRKEIGSANYHLLFRRMKRAIGMLFVAAETRFFSKYSEHESSFTCAGCFQVLGIDLLVDESLNPRIVEVNGQPSMELYGDSGLHYDSIKLRVQNEAARIVLHHTPETIESIVLDSEFWTLMKKELDGVRENESIVKYILKLFGEYAALESFIPAYPDLEWCTNASRRRLFDEFISHVSRPPGFGARVDSHKLIQKAFCAILWKANETKYFDSDS